VPGDDLWTQRCQEVAVVHRGGLIPVVLCMDSQPQLRKSTQEIRSLSWVPRSENRNARMFSLSSSIHELPAGAHCDRSTVYEWPIFDKWNPSFALEYICSGMKMREIAGPMPDSVESRPERKGNCTETDSIAFIQNTAEGACRFRLKIFLDSVRQWHDFKSSE